MPLLYVIAVKDVLGLFHKTYISNVQDSVSLFCLEYDDDNSCSDRNAGWHQIFVQTCTFKVFSNKWSIKALGLVNLVHSLDVIVS